MERIIRNWVSEFVGTFLLLFVGVAAQGICFSTLWGQNVLPNDTIRLIITACAFAGAIVAVVYSPVGKTSGAHINPAVSFAFLLEKKMTFLDAILAMEAQVCGAVGAVWAVKRLLGQNVNGLHFGMTIPGAEHGLIFVFLVEAILTALLIGIIFYCLHHPPFIKYTGWVVGFYIAIAATSSAGISGASFNPARSLGPAIVAWDFSSQWIYIIAPMVGSALAVMLHRILPILERPLGVKLHHLAEEYRAHHMRHAQNRQSEKESTL